MKKIICSILVLVMSITMLLTGCGDKATKAGNEDRLKISIAFPGADESWKNDDYYKYITDKFNIDIDFQTLSESSANEKARIMINSGDMPDAIWTYYNADEYVQYAKQGLIAELPENFDEKYPNLGFVNAMTGVYDVLKEKANGKNYCVMTSMDSYRDFIDDFRAAYADGKNLREMMNEQEYMSLSAYGFVYRKDWAEKLGIETDYIMDYDDFIDMALKFKEADLGNVGSENTVGIAVDYTEAPNIFITAHNTSYKYFHKDETGKYVCGLLDKETTDGLKAYADAYRKGVISPDFYTLKPGDLDSIFCSQRSGIIFPRSPVYYFRTLYSDFEKANPGLKGDECLAACWLRSPDGKVHVRQNSNGGNCGWLFNPNISDEKLERLLELMDYCSSPEGGPQVRLGVPNVDYKYENGEYIITREKNASGNYDSLDNLYPSYDCFRYMGNPHFDLTIDPNPYAKGEDDALLNAIRKEELSLMAWDVDRDSYVSDEMTKFKAAYDVNNMFAEIVVSNGDVEKLWEAKRKEISTDAKKIADDMNKTLLK